MKYYTGVGSRDTPHHILHLMTRIADRLASHDYVLRTGDARGADAAFLDGIAHSRADMYTRADACERSMAITEQYHPAWHRCSLKARQFHARNVKQVLGTNLDNPSKILICWTIDGNATGGTGQAMRIAEAYDVPIINLYFDRKTCLHQIKHHLNL